MSKERQNELLLNSRSRREQELHQLPSLSPGNLYLILYNVFQWLGWLIVLVQTLHHISVVGQIGGLWQNTHSVLKIFQTLAVMEIVHCAIGLVPSSVVLTGFQVFSRVSVLWGVCVVSTRSQMSIGFPILLVAWSITEVIRYSYYFLNILHKVPYQLLYLRYTLFIALYPMGVVGELLCIYNALPIVAKTNMFSITMPNAFNFTFDYYSTLLVVMFLYLPIFPQLYLHMFAQRRKLLQTSHRVE